MTVATKLTPKKRETFLLHLAETGNVTKSCQLTGISRDSLYKLKNSNEEFAEQWERARLIAADALEDAAWRRAVEGIDRPLSYQGELSGHFIREYSDTLLIFLLKGNKPEKFKDRVDNRHSGHMTGNATVVFESNGRELVDD